MPEMTEIKINMLTVEQYMSVIEHDDSVGLTADKCEEVRKKFRRCIQSYIKYIKGSGIWENTTVWVAFIAMLQLFRYLTSGDYADATNEGKVKALLNKDHEGDEIAATLQDASFLFSHKPVFAAIDKSVNEKQNCDLLLEGLNKESTIEAVLWRLWKYVEDGMQEGFKEIAQKGFDVDLDELKAIEDEYKEKDQNLLISQCKKMYDAGVKQIVFTGAPGTGKTYTANKFAEDMIRMEYLKENRRATEAEIKTHIKRVQFHASYDYSDFVEGLRPVIIEGQDKMSFVRMDGGFKEFCRTSLEKKDKMPYFFIIDEINRADLSRVFGELMYCLDENNRAKGMAGKDVERVGVTTQYANLPTYQIEDGKAVEIKDDVYKNKFAIPENLYILATMNDIDRSVEAFDFALRRRFKWIETKANDEMENGLRGMLGADVDENAITKLTKNVKDMNEVIVTEGAKLRLDSSYQIGHAYFKDYKGTDTSLQNIWDTQIMMILKEYCRGKKDSEEFIDKCKKSLLKDQGEKE